MYILSIKKFSYNYCVCPVPVTDFIKESKIYKVVITVRNVQLIPNVWSLVLWKINKEYICASPLYLHPPWIKTPRIILYTKRYISSKNDLEKFLYRRTTRNFYTFFSRLFLPGYVCVGFFLTQSTIVWWESKSGVSWTKRYISSKNELVKGKTPQH